MSSFYNYWNRLCRSNASLCDEKSKMTISVASFRKQLEKAHQDGCEESKDDKSVFESLFGKPFGGR